MRHLILIALILLPECSTTVGTSDAVAPVADSAGEGVAEPDTRVACPAPAAGEVSVEVALDATVATVDDRFLSVAVDASQVVGGNWWTAGEGSSGGVGGGRVEPFDFGRPRLLNLARALAPAYLRIGGSEADKTYYDMGESPVADAPEPYHFVLTAAQLSGLYQFAETAGFDLFFTVNAGPGPRNEDGQWTTDQARTLFEFAAAQGIQFDVLELGNELNGFGLLHGLDNVVSPEQFAADMLLLSALRDELAPDAVTAGPACAYWPFWGEMSPFTQDYLALEKGLPDVVTWHYYPQQSSRCPLASQPAGDDVMLAPANLDEVQQWAGEVEVAAEDRPSWLGETGNAQCGGEPGLSDRFVAGFWWLDQLGLMARRGHRVVVRQTLSGSDYGLINDETLVPNPDYWNSVLWKQTMGSRVLAVSHDGPDTLRVYAHCTPESHPGGQSGAISLLALNLSETETRPLRLPVESGAALVYLLTAEERLSETVALNGMPLAANVDGTLPALEPASQSCAGGFPHLELPPLSYAFVVLSNAGAPACL